MVKHKGLSIGPWGKYSMLKNIILIIIVLLVVLIVIGAIIYGIIALKIYIVNLLKKQDSNESK